MIQRAMIGLAAAMFAAAALPAAAQPSAFTKTTLQDQDFPPPIYHTVTVRTVVRHGGEVAPHTHPGVEMGLVVAGQALLTVKDQPPKSIAAGGSFAIPPRTVHSVKNTGPGELTMVSTYVVDKNQPIASPAP